MPMRYAFHFDNKSLRRVVCSAIDGIDISPSFSRLRGRPGMARNDRSRLLVNRLQCCGVDPDERSRRQRQRHRSARARQRKSSLNQAAKGSALLRRGSFARIPEMRSPRRLGLRRWSGRRPRHHRDGEAAVCTWSRGERRSPLVGARHRRSRRSRQGRAPLAPTSERPRKAGRRGMCPRRSDDLTSFSMMP